MPTRRQIAALAWPIVLANLGIPLLGLVDTAVIGHVGAVADLGAIGLGALIFSFVFWGFGFLRMGTTGFIAQASGRGDSAEVRATVARALLIAGGVGVLLLLLQVPIAWISFRLIGASQDVEQIARGYFDLRIWAAPASLASYGVTGALIGLGRTRAVLVTQLVLNGLNIALDLLFAAVLGWGVQGIAAGTAIAEWSAAAVGVWLLMRILRQERRDDEPWWPRLRILDGAKARAMLGANADIMVRTLFLLFGFGWFTNQGALFGDAILAANYVLVQIITFSAFLLDGFAYSTELLVGRAVGAGDANAFDRSVRLTSELSGVTAVVLAVVAIAIGPAVITGLTDLDAVRDIALRYLPWAVAYITVSFAAFQLDGIFIGATATREMRNVYAVVVPAFVVLSLVLVARWANTGLWVAFIGFVVLRAGGLGAMYGRVRGRVYPAHARSEA